MSTILHLIKMVVADMLQGYFIELMTLDKRKVQKSFFLNPKHKAVNCCIKVASSVSTYNFGLSIRHYDKISQENLTWINGF